MSIENVASNKKDKQTTEIGTVTSTVKYYRTFVLPIDKLAAQS